MTRRPLTMAVSLSLALVLPTGAARAAKKNEVPGSFHDAKQRDTSREAWARAEARLGRVRAGIPEMEFLEIMEMQVLARRGRPIDARMAGYLVQRSKEANARLDRGRRALVFGYVEGSSEVARATVVLRERRVEEVRFAAPALAAVRPPDTTAGAGARDR